MTVPFSRSALAIRRSRFIRPDAVTLAEPDKIEQLIVEHAAVLLGIDPVMAFFGKVDSHKDQEIP